MPLALLPSMVCQESWFPFKLTFSVATTAKTITLVWTVVLPCLFRRASKTFGVPWFTKPKSSKSLSFCSMETLTFSVYMRTLVMRPRTLSQCKTRDPAISAGSCVKLTPTAAKSLISRTLTIHRTTNNHCARRTELNMLPDKLIRLAYLKIPSVGI